MTNDHSEVEARGFLNFEISTDLYLQLSATQFEFVRNRRCDFAAQFQLWAHLTNR